MRFKYKIVGEEIRAYIDEDSYYCTNRYGDGLFKVCLSRNTRTQIIGTCDFSVHGLKDKSKKDKLRNALSD